MSSPPSGIDEAIWAELPDDIRNELMSESIRTTAEAARAEATIASENNVLPPEGVQSATQDEISQFFDLLDPETRSQALLSLPPDQLSLISPNLREEAERLSIHATSSNWGQTRNHSSPRYKVLVKESLNENRRTPVIPLKNEMESCQAITKLFLKRSSSLDRLENILTLHCLVEESRNWVVGEIISHRPFCLHAVSFLGNLLVQQEGARLCAVKLHGQQLFDLLSLLGDCNNANNLAILTCLDAVADNELLTAHHEEEGLDHLSLLLVDEECREKEFALAKRVASKLAGHFGARRAPILIARLDVVCLSLAQEVLASLKQKTDDSGDDVVFAEQRLLRVVQTMKTISSAVVFPDVFQAIWDQLKTALLSIKSKPLLAPGVSETLSNDASSSSSSSHGGEEVEQEDGEEEEEEEDGEGEATLNHMDLGFMFANPFQHFQTQEDAEESGEEEEENDEDDDEDDDREESQLEDEGDDHALWIQRRLHPPTRSIPISSVSSKSNRFLCLVECFLEAHDDDCVLETFGSLHADFFNALVKERPSLLTSSSLEALVKKPGLRKTLDFENKRTYFRIKLKQFNQQPQHQRVRPLRLNIRRNHVFDDSYNQLSQKSAEEMRGPLNISFKGEEAMDAGGPTKEWFRVLIREMFLPGYALFTPSENAFSAYQPDPRSHLAIGNNHVQLFKFAGRVLGKALSMNLLVDVHFTRSFYKHLLGREVAFADLESLDKSYFESLNNLIDMDPELLSALDFRFTMEVEQFGSRHSVELKPNGSLIKVTAENLHEYIKLTTHHKLSLAIQKQTESFLQGFYELIPSELISYFDPQEIELLLSGTPRIDLEDLKRNTEYHSGYTAESNQIVWFWNTLESASQEERAKFLMFVTGTSLVPLDGFKSLMGMGGRVQKFSIHRCGDSANLPGAHTCFNQLDLPQYATEEILRKKLTLAFSECSEGFGFA